MEHLVSELRGAYADAPQGCKLVAVHLFAIRHAVELESFKASDRGSLVKQAGIGLMYGDEIRIVAKVSRYARYKAYPSRQHPPLPSYKSSKETLGRDPYSLAEKLEEAYNSAPEGERTIAMIVFGIKYADHIRGDTLSQLVARTELDPGVYLAIRKGRKLAEYVEIKYHFETEGGQEVRSDPPSQQVFHGIIPRRPSKYLPIAKYCSEIDQKEFTLTFEEIEQLIGFKLPKSAELPAYWANTSDLSRPIRSAMRETQYNTHLIVGEHKVTFKRK